MRTCPRCHKEVKEPSNKETSRDLCPWCSFPLMLVAGKYRLQKLLDEGNMGKVYLAHHVHLTENPERVVKVMKKHVLTRPGMVERFMREVRVTAALSQRNDHIVKIYDDFGEEKGFGHYYVMEYLDGQSLKKLLKPNEPLARELTFHIFEQLALGMRLAHAEGVIHRDLKPENIFLVKRGDDPFFVKIIDFGIAKPLHRNVHTGLTQGAIGTPDYMAPEQCLNLSTIDNRCDIYAMGVILYELLTGMTPFAHLGKDPLVTMNAQVSENPSPMRELRPDLDIEEELDAVVLKALEKNPDDRFASVEEFWEALEPFYSRDFDENFLQNLAQMTGTVEYQSSSQKSSKTSHSYSSKNEEKIPYREKLRPKKQRKAKRKASSEHMNINIRTGRIERVSAPPEKLDPMTTTPTLVNELPQDTIKRPNFLQRGSTGKVESFPVDEADFEKIKDQLPTNVKPTQSHPFRLSEPVRDEEELELPIEEDTFDSESRSTDEHEEDPFSTDERDQIFDNDRTFNGTLNLTEHDIVDGTIEVQLEDLQQSHSSDEAHYIDIASSSPQDNIVEELSKTMPMSSVPPYEELELLLDELAEDDEEEKTSPILPASRDELPPHSRRSLHQRDLELKLDLETAHYVGQQQTKKTPNLFRKADDLNDHEASAKEYLKFSLTEPYQEERGERPLPTTKEQIGDIFAETAKKLNFLTQPQSKEKLSPPTDFLKVSRESKDFLKKTQITSIRPDELATDEYDNFDALRTALKLPHTSKTPSLDDDELEPLPTMLQPLDEEDDEEDDDELEPLPTMLQPLDEEEEEDSLEPLPTILQPLDDEEEEEDEDKTLASEKLDPAALVADTVQSELQRTMESSINFEEIQKIIKQQQEIEKEQFLLHDWNEFDEDDLERTLSQSPREIQENYENSTYLASSENENCEEEKEEEKALQRKVEEGESGWWDKSFLLYFAIAWAMLLLAGLLIFVNWGKLPIPPIFQKNVQRENAPSLVENEPKLQPILQSETPQFQQESQEKSSSDAGVLDTKTPLPDLLVVDASTGKKELTHDADKTLAPVKEKKGKGKGKRKYRKKYGKFSKKYRKKRRKRRRHFAKKHRKKHKRKASKSLLNESKIPSKQAHRVRQNDCNKSYYQRKMKAALKCYQTLLKEGVKDDYIYVQMGFASAMIGHCTEPYHHLFSRKRCYEAKGFFERYLKRHPRGSTSNQLRDILSKGWGRYLFSKKRRAIGKSAPKKRRKLSSRSEKENKKLPPLPPKIPTKQTSSASKDSNNISKLEDILINPN